MFTWWRRFHTPFKLKPQHLSKVRSELLQRIEFGEFECDPLWQQSYLEDKIFEVKAAEIEIEYARSNRDTIDDRLRHEQKKSHKRKSTMREKHLEAENRMLMQLADALAAEFDFTREYVQEVMESFDGTTRHLYFHIMALKHDRQIPDAEDVQMIPRIVDAQPRHIMKPSEGKWFPLWKKTVTEKKIW
mgnify:CR=1 FL=1